MRLAWTADGPTWRLHLRLDPHEGLNAQGQNRARIRLLTNECSVTLPEKVAEPHPDVLALAGLMVARPWCRRTVRFDRPVSATFAEAVRAGGLDAGPVDDQLAPRTPGPRVGLSYSGGVDSVALAELLPPDTPLVHLVRVPHPRVPDRWGPRADVMSGLVAEAGRRGRETYLVRTDLEHLCLPRPQLPTWPAVGIGAVLLADRLREGALGFGSVLESVYLQGGRRWVPHINRSWHRTVAAAGLPLCRPTAGLTEVGTLRMAAGSQLADLARSCQLGRAGNPCRGCPKCLRKELIAAAVDGRGLPRPVRGRLVPGHPMLRETTGPPPYHMQNVLAYVLARVPGLGGTPLADFAARLGASVATTTWNERFYPPALDDVPQPWRTGAAERLSQVTWMSDADIATVQAWDGTAGDS